MGSNKGFQLGTDYTKIKERTEVYQTYLKSHLGRGCSNIVQHGLTEVEIIVSTDITGNKVTLPGNNAKIGYVLQNKVTGDEFSINGVIGDVIRVDADELKVVIGITGEAFAVKKVVMSQLNADGAMEVITTPGPLIFTRDAADQVVIEDTVANANSRPLPTKILDDVGKNVDSRSILASIHVSCGATPITAAGIIVGVIASSGKEIQVSNNANTLVVEVNGVPVLTSLSGSPSSVKVDMSVGNIVIKSLGATISLGDVAINITG